MSKITRVAYLLAGLAALNPPRASAREARPADPLEERRLECTRKLDGDCFVALADFEAAAEAFARFSAEHADDLRAPAMLVRAARLRRQLGQPERVLEVARDFRRRYSAHPGMADVAEEVFLLGALYRERRQPEREAATHDLYLKDWARFGGLDRAIVAHVRLAAFLLDESCPVAGMRGACIELRQVPFNCSELGSAWDGVDQQPTNLTKEIAIMHRRDPALAGRANQHLRLANRLLAKMKAESAEEGSTIGQARRNDLADAAADSILLGVYRARDEYLALRQKPSGLNLNFPQPGDSPTEAARKRWENADSQHRLADWLITKTRLRKSLQDAARGAMTKLGPTSIVRASGLLAEVANSFWRTMAGDEEEQRRSCPPPRGIVEDGDRWLLEDDTYAAMAVCSALADSVPLDDEWSAFCQPQRRANRHSYFVGTVRPKPLGRQDELTPSFETRITLDSTTNKPAYNPATEIGGERFPIHPFPGRAGMTKAGLLQRVGSGKHIPGFVRPPAFDIGLLDKLASRAGPFEAPNRASLMRMLILGAGWKCFYPPTMTLLVETARNRVVKLEIPEDRANNDCLEEAAKALVLPETYFKEEHARWRVDL